MSGDHNDSGWRKRQIALDIKAENARELGLDYETDKTIMDMAREAGICTWLKPPSDVVERIERFAALVRAGERNRTWTQEHWTEYERNIAAVEREACAKVCEDSFEYAGDDLAQRIRARGTTPPAAQRPWVGLTDEDDIDWDGGDLKDLVKAIEAKLKEKNNAT